ncbi:MAG TPA: acyl-CoA dehydrogenase family protein [Gammaproteobacteria bacterium]|nr:acyl-CoA dehydrogenase family protein [Gammaproteobacteria bacterium]
MSAHEPVTPESGDPAVPAAANMPDTRGINFFREDWLVRSLLDRLLPADTPADYRRALDDLGALVGGRLDECAAAADRYPPGLTTRDARGQRVDTIRYCGEYRELEAIGFGRLGLAAMSHRDGVLGFPGPAPHVAKYTLQYLFCQAEFGTMCPISMTDSLARILRLFGSAQIRERFLPRLTSQDMSTLWQGAMFLTEQAGGSDVGATESVAEHAGDVAPPYGISDAPLWRLYGDKWFCSNADAELALTLARPPGAPAGTRGLGLFLVPRFLPDGSLNGVVLHRLKDKLGARAMASGEITLEGALAFQVGELDRGFRHMAEMINVSRLSNAMRSAGLMRRAFVEGLVHARGRIAFGRPLAEFPMIRQTLLGMLVDTAGALAACLRTARRLDLADCGDRSARAQVRLLTPLLKAVVTERARRVTTHAMDLRGGNGYIEDWPNARLLRDSHLGSIWEGATNVVMLDVLRAIRRENAHAAFFAFVRDLLPEPGGDGNASALAAALGGAADTLAAQADELAGLGDTEAQLRLRTFVIRLHDLLASACLLEHAGENPAGDAILAIAALHAARHLGPADPLADPRWLGWLAGLADGSLTIGPDSGVLGELIATMC